MRCPCYHCEERHEGCHSDCERYAEWNEKHQAVMDRKAKDKTAKDMVDRFMIDNSARRKKYKGLR